jgi:hypothetical protein
MASVFDESRMDIVKDEKGRLLFVFLERKTVMNYDIWARQDWTDGMSNHTMIALHTLLRGTQDSNILLSGGQETCSILTHSTNYEKKNTNRD